MVTNSPAQSAPGDAVMPLHAQVTGQGPPVLLLHGLFGMGSNLGGIARALAPAYEVHQLDLPNHGRSPWTASMTLSDLAAAVVAYANAQRLPALRVLGHSLGGKVAMQLALDAPARVASLVVADIAPVGYAPSHDGVFAAIEAVTRVGPKSRSEAGDCLREHLREEAVVQFLLLSLARDAAGVYQWRFNAAVLREQYGALRAAPIGNPWPGFALFIYGELSNYVDETGRGAARRLFPAARFEAIAGAGHWLHAEKPKAFNTAVLAFLQACDGLEGPR